MDGDEIWVVFCHNLRREAFIDWSLEEMHNKGMLHSWTLLCRLEHLCSNKDQQYWTHTINWNPSSEATALSGSWDRQVVWHNGSRGTWPKQNFWLFLQLHLLWIQAGQAGFSSMVSLGKAFHGRVSRASGAYLCKLRQWQDCIDTGFATCLPGVCNQDWKCTESGAVSPWHCWTPTPPTRKDKSSGNIREKCECQLS